MNRYILSEYEHPLSTDYYYEANHTTNESAIYVASHSHNYFEIYMYIRGEVQVLLNNHIFNVKKGDIVVIPPYNVHSLLPLKLGTPYERMYLYITETCLSSFQFNEYTLLKPLMAAEKLGKFHFHISDPKDYERITHGIKSIRNSKREDYYGKELMNRSYILQVFATINKYITNETREKSTDETTSLISQIIEYINENFMKNITLEMLCEYFYTNRQTLTRLFKEYTTLTIHNYITLIRITRAKKLIYEGVPPSKIHLLCGFNDYTTFYRAFKRTEVITPQQFAVLSQGKLSREIKCPEVCPNDYKMQ